MKSVRFALCALALADASNALAQEESAGAEHPAVQLFVEAPAVPQPPEARPDEEFVPAPPLLKADELAPKAEVTLPETRPIPEVRPAPQPAQPPKAEAPIPPPERVTVTAPTALSQAPAAPAAGEVKLTAPKPGSEPLRGGRFFAQTDGALTASTSPSKDAAAITLTGRGGYLFTPQLAGGLKLTWSANGQGSLVGGGLFGAYHISIGNPRIVPEIGGGLTVYAASANDVTHAGVLLDATGALDVFVTDSVAIQPYLTLAMGSLWGQPLLEARLGWALAVYF